MSGPSHSGSSRLRNESTCPALGRKSGDGGLQDELREYIHGRAATGVTQRAWYKRKAQQFGTRIKGPEGREDAALEAAEGEGDLQWKG